MSVTLEQLSQVERVLLLGAGREGRSTYTYLDVHYPQLHIAIADRAPLEKLNPAFRETIQNDERSTLITGPDYLQPIADYDLIFKSPGISPLLPEIADAERRGALITSNTQLFFEATPANIHIGITGTKGKSTTTSMIFTILQHAGKDVRLTGNIGTPPLDVLDNSITEDTIFVIELSSYQLYDLHQSPQVAVLQAIVPEHLTWHGDFAAYVDAKQNITRFQSENDKLIVNTDDPLPRAIAEDSDAKVIPFGLHGGRCTLKDDVLVLDNQPVISIDEIPLHGTFNLLNVMPGILIADLLGIELSMIAEGIHAFRTLAHRLELVAEINRVRYYDDSLATVPEAAIAAIEGFRPAEIILIAGGYDREVDYTLLASCIAREPVKYLALFPTTGERIIDALQKESPGQLPAYDFVNTMQEAVRLAASHATAGDVVLLSPASASFNLFKDYRDRGEQFTQAVLGLQD